MPHDSVSTNTEQAPQEQIIQPQPTKEAPYLVEGYPYGGLRTQVHYWIETSKRYGQRLVFQSLNPKTGRWNAPKPGGYCQIMLATLDEKQHVTSAGISMSYRTVEEAQKFEAKYGAYLSDYQKTELSNIIKMLEVYSKVEYKIHVKKYKNLLTGEISTSVNVFDLGNVIEVNDLGDPVDEKAEKDIDRDITRAVNIAAVKNAAKTTSTDEAMGTFKRS